MNNWISVDERLPKRQADYLVYIPEGIQVVLWFNGYDWVVDEAYYAFDSVEITHWMTLPEPPKEEP